MSAGRFNEIPIYAHRAPPTENRVPHKESQWIPADQARFGASLLISENQILNKQRQTIHMIRLLQTLTGSAEIAFLWVIESRSSPVFDAW